MTHVVTERCVRCRYTDCVAVCPVFCFYEIEDPSALVIDPDTCIDCQACVPACPVNAIWFQGELPPEYQEWIGLNRRLFPGGVNILEPKGPLPTAVDRQEIQARERARGWTITEPSAAES
ncbi:MAG TPA: ferredoxin family protein [Opitutaceae bacterium]|jgi:ferredoxin